MTSYHPRYAHPRAMPRFTRTSASAAPAAAAAYKPRAYAHAPPNPAMLSVGPLRAPRNAVLAAVLMLVLSAWLRHIGLFAALPSLASLDFAASPPASTRRPAAPVFEYGSVKLDRVVQYEGDGLDRQARDATRADAAEVAARVAGNAGNRERDDERREEHVVARKEERGAALEPENDGDLGGVDERKEVAAPEVAAPAVAQEKPAHNDSAASADLKPKGDGESVSVRAAQHGTVEQQETPSNKSGGANERQESAQRDHVDGAAKMESSNDSKDVGGTMATTKGEEQSSVPLHEVLKFSKKTAINFMHFHKTGGVSFKAALHKFYANKTKRNGEAVVTRDACYVREGVSDDPGMPTFDLWRCDWDPIREMDEAGRNSHDIIFGHQFCGDGAETLLTQRDLRTFTVLRHPFDRKVSFYFHFFVREVGRNESDVTFEEMRDFLLFDRLVIDADLGRDLGPNYMAGRLLSNGRDGFVGNSSFRYYDAEREGKQRVAERALALIRGYVFVGLQSQSSASKCMLRKVMEVFNDVHGVDNGGIEEIDRAAALNRGSYSLGAEEIWSRLSREDRILFDRKERVDLTIYQEGERLFRRHVRAFGCEHRVQERAGASLLR